MRDYNSKGNRKKKIEEREKRNRIYIIRKSVR